MATMTITPAIFRAYTNEHDGYFMGGWHKDPSEAWLHALRSYFGEAGGITCCPMAFKVRGSPIRASPERFWPTKNRAARKMNTELIMQARICTQAVLIPVS